MIFLTTESRFWPLLNRASFFEEAEEVLKKGLELKNQTAKTKPGLPKSEKRATTSLGTSQLKRSQNIYSQILITFKIKNLVTSDCVKDWGKVAPRQD